MIRSIAKDLIYGFLAGTLITIGCAVFLACKGMGDTLGNIVGAIMFSVALLVICIKGYNLYTGKIGLIVASHKKENVSELFLGLLGNTLACMLWGTLLMVAIPSMKETAVAVVGAKLTQSFASGLIRSIFCGILMYLAVSIYKEKQTIVGILFCIPVFILAGFEHSIADMGYFAVAGEWSAKGLGYIWTIILGNTIGAIIFPLLKLIVKERKKDAIDSQQN